MNTNEIHMKPAVPNAVTANIGYDFGSLITTLRAGACWFAGETDEGDLDTTPEVRFAAVLLTAADWLAAIGEDRMRETLNRGA